MTAIASLTLLLPSTPYLLAYAVPLLTTSLFLAFSGTFFTLDRSRAFPSAAKESDTSYAALSTPGGFTTLAKKPWKVTWALEGGLGGLAGGFAFGVHLSTALALLIPATTSAGSLSAKSFLAIWVITCAVTTPLAARFRYAAYTFLGISGGTLTALAFSIAAHPALRSRIILTAIFLPSFTISLLLFSVLPASRMTTLMMHALLRFCTASTGAFGIIASIALLMRPQEEGWANAWERLWMATSPVGPNGQIWWGSSQEQGLSAGYAVFLFAGVAVDWALRKWIGECPDEKWDNYLANYTASLPNEAHRTGSFKPYRSLMERFFTSEHHGATEKDILFPHEADMKTAFPSPYTHGNLPITMHNASADTKATKGIELTSVPPGTELLKKKRSKKSRGWKFGDGIDQRGRKPVKFGGAPDSSDEDEDEDATLAKQAPSSSASGSPLSQHRALRFVERKASADAGHGNGHTARTSSSTPTLVDHPTTTTGALRKDTDTRAPLDYELEIAQLKARLRRRTSAAPSTAVDTAGERRELEGDFALEYSDYEEDVAAQRGLLRRASLAAARAAPDVEGAWTPGFLQRLAENTTAAAEQVSEFAPPRPAPVPATPSLLRALDRLALAQHEAYGGGGAARPSPLGTSPASAVAETAADREAPRRTSGEGRRESDLPGAGGPGRVPRWEEFWREVRAKAQT